MSTILRDNVSIMLKQFEAQRFCKSHVFEFALKIVNLGPCSFQPLRVKLDLELD